LRQTLSEPSEAVAACLEENAGDNGSQAPEQDYGSTRYPVTHGFHFQSPRKQRPSTGWRKLMLPELALSTLAKTVQTTG
jgi:hypothetical protein